MNDKILQAKWIWESSEVEIPNQHVVFRKTFTAKAGGAARLALSCDTDFRAYLNGRLAGKDQFPDYPWEKTYSVFGLNELRDGENVLEIRAFYCGIDSFTYARGRAGLIVALEIAGGDVILSDETWSAAKDPAFGNERLDMVTPQLGLVTEYEARKEGRLDWHPAVVREGAVSGYVTSLTARPLPPLVTRQKLSAEVLSLLPVRRMVQSGTFADIVRGDVVCSAESADGIMVVGDLGRECVGEFYLELCARAGIVVDISYGEYLLEGRVQNKIHSRNFTHRYVCRDGDNQFVLPYMRLGGRYLQLSIMAEDNEFELRDFGIQETVQSLPEPCHFKTDSAEAERLYRTALNTLECCMHNHYEDCPWREQGLYGYDSRFQMLFNYYAYGNYEFARESLDLMGRGLNPENGYLALCSPTRYSIAIPCFSMVWVSALYEYYLFSGDRSLLEKYWDQLLFMAKSYMSEEQDGLYLPKDDQTLWHFYEWVEGLANTDAAANPIFGNRSGRIQVLFNAYLYEMLMSMAKIFTALKDEENSRRYEGLADCLGEAINRRFWDAERQCYGTVLENGRLGKLCHVHTQVVLLRNGLVPADRLPGVRTALFSGRLVPLSLSPMTYELEARFALGTEERRAMVKRMDGLFRKMIDEGATSFYETEDGCRAFDGAGSLCHAWSSIHAYYYGSKVLGVRPLEPGFKTFEVKVYPGSFQWASGEVPTPQGRIHVSWKLQDGRIHLKVSHPAGVKMVAAEYPEAPVDVGNVNAAD